MKYLSIFLLSCLVLLSCQKKQAPAVDAPDTTTEELTSLSEGEQLQLLYKKADSLMNIGEIDTELMQEYVNRALRYTEANPNDSLASKYIFFAGIFEMKIAGSTADEILRDELYTNTINIFNSLIKRYPNFPHLEYCYWYKGTIYENMKRPNDAESEYRELVHLFPDSELAEGTKLYLQSQGYKKDADAIMNDIKNKK